MKNNKKMSAFVNEGSKCIQNKTDFYWFRIDLRERVCFKTAIKES